MTGSPLVGARVRRLVAAGVLALGVVLVGIVALSSKTRDLVPNGRTGRLDTNPLPTRSPAPRSGRPTASSVQSTGGHIGGEILLVLLAIAGAVVIIVVIRYLLRTVLGVHLRGRYRRWRDTAQDVEFGVESISQQALADTVAASLARIERGTPTDAIIECWIRLEDAVADAGVRRLPAETSTELAQRVLAEYESASRPLAGLNALYREARFSDHSMTERDRRQARAALELVQDSLLEQRAPEPSSAEAAEQRPSRPGGHR